MNSTSRRTIPNSQDADRLFIAPNALSVDRNEITVSDDDSDEDDEDEEELFHEVNPRPSKRRRRAASPAVPATRSQTSTTSSSSLPSSASSRAVVVDDEEENQEVDLDEVFGPGFSQTDPKTVQELLMSDPQLNQTFNLIYNSRHQARDLAAQSARPVVVTPPPTPPSPQRPRRRPLPLGSLSSISSAPSVRSASSTSASSQLAPNSPLASDSSDSKKVSVLLASEIIPKPLKIKIVVTAPLLTIVQYLADRFASGDVGKVCRGSFSPCWAWLHTLTLFCPCFDVQIELVFDGDKLDPRQSAQDYDIEEDYQIDFLVKR